MRSYLITARARDGTFLAQREIRATSLYEAERDGRAWAARLYGAELVEIEETER